LLLVCLALALSSTNGAAQLGDPVSLSVPAEFVREITLPGTMDHFLRPSAIYIDPQFEEVFVADPGHNRIVVLDVGGTYKFEFAGSDYFASPLDVDVDSEGYIYVLGSTSSGRRLFRFDFDGTFHSEVTIPETDDGERPDIRSVAVGQGDVLYLLDVRGRQLLSATPDGEVRTLVTLLRDMDEAARQEQTFGSLRAKGDRIYVPVPTLGTVYVFGADGRLERTVGRKGHKIGELNFERTVGRKGNKIGELNFPVDIAVTDDGLHLVLDKNRFNVVCFDPDGRFLGEFGGKGVRHGWFYHPSLLAIDPEDYVYIGQIYQNMVQICRIPDFIAGVSQHGTIEEETGMPLAGISVPN
jgi:DNA-binding beta-propeller fold protein YncE